MVFETITRYLDWQLIAFIVLFVYALNFACMPGNVFNPRLKSNVNSTDSYYCSSTGDRYFLDHYLLRHLGRYWSKPILQCPICMCSFWGSIIYLTFSEHYSVVQWAVTVIAAAGLARLLKSFSQ